MTDHASNPHLEVLATMGFEKNGRRSELMGIEALARL
jgi:hypothetical protein